MPFCWPVLFIFIGLFSLLAFYLFTSLCFSFFLFFVDIFLLCFIEIFRTFVFGVSAFVSYFSCFFFFSDLFIYRLVLFMGIFFVMHFLFRSFLFIGLFFLKAFSVVKLYYLPARYVKPIRKKSSLTACRIAYFHNDGARREWLD